MKKNDLILIAVVVILATAIFITNGISNTKANEVIVTLNNSIIDSIPINTNCTRIYNCDNGYNIIEINNLKVRVIEADCKNQICVNTSCIGNIGEVICCMPHRFEVYIK